MRNASALRTLAACVLLSLFAATARSQSCTEASDVVQTNAAGSGAGLAAVGFPVDTGQSFTSPCNGVLNAIEVSVKAFNNAQTSISGTLKVYASEGTQTGDVENATVTTQAFSFTATGNQRVTLSTPVSVTAGSSYTFFFDATGGSGSLDTSPDNTAYTGGTIYQGNSASVATARTTDLVFTADLAAAATGACTEASDVVQSNSAGSGAGLAGMGFPTDTGQSFTAPCTGYLNAIEVSVLAFNNAQTSISGTLKVYAGEGTQTGNVEKATATTQAFSFNTTGTQRVTLSAPVAVTSGSVYTFFFDAVGGSGSLATGADNTVYSGGTIYQGNNASEATARTTDLVFTADLSNTALPVELASFTATTTGGAARLRWTTESETSNAGFHVEQQTGQLWRELAFVAGRGTTAERTDYVYTVLGLAPGPHSFRLRQVDFDGTTSYSPAVEVTVGLEGAALVEVRGASVHFAVRELQAVRVEAFNALGQRVALLFDGEAQAGQTHSVEFPTLASGVYVLRVRGTTFTRGVTVIR